jgi:hypothetical protein
MYVRSVRTANINTQDRITCKGTHKHIMKTQRVPINMFAILDMSASITSTKTRTIHSCETSSHKDQKVAVEGAGDE